MIINKHYKIQQTLLNHTRRKLTDLDALKQNISIDDSLILWKGRLSWKQYIPSKRTDLELKFTICVEDLQDKSINNLHG